MEVNKHEQRDKKWKAWQQIIEDWEKSDLSIKAYCKDKGLRPHTFYRWRNKIKPSNKVNPLTKWTAIMEDWRKSGLGMSAYCREKKVPTPSLSSWNKRLNPTIKKDPREKWTHIIEEWKKSGLKRHAYCIKNQIDAPSFYLWEKKLDPSISRKSQTLVALERWTPIMEDWKKSGLGVVAYCRKIGIPHGNFGKWRKRLAPSDSLDLIPESSKGHLQHLNKERPLSSNSYISSYPFIIKIEIKMSQGHRLYLEGEFEWEKLTSWLYLLLMR
jgi:hypothetical protein